MVDLIHVDTTFWLKPWLKLISFGSNGLAKVLVTTNSEPGFQDQLSLNAGQKYCKMLQGEHSAILSTFIKLPFVIKIYVLSIFEWPFYTSFTVTGTRSVSNYYYSPISFFDNFSHDQPAHI